MVVIENKTEIPTFSKQRYKQYKEDSKSATLSQSCYEFGGGGSEAITVIEVDDEEQDNNTNRKKVL